jgi:hypothetical protein
MVQQEQLTQVVVVVEVSKQGPGRQEQGGSGIVIVKELNKASGSWPLRAQFSARKSGTWVETQASVSFDYLVVAGGGGAGGGSPRFLMELGGGGAGGYRTSFPGGTKITLTGYGPFSTPVTVGAGGAGLQEVPGSNGNPSIFSTITSAGGGGGGSDQAPPGVQVDKQEDQVVEEQEGWS